MEPSLSQRNLNISEEELERVAAVVVRHMVFKHASAPGVPVKRDELAEVVQKEHKLRGLTNEAIAAAQRICRGTLGFEMKELERVPTRRGGGADRAGASQQAAVVGSTRVYALTSTLDPQLLRKYVLTDDSLARSALTLTVCGLVLSGGGALEEARLWALLGRVGLGRDTVDHPSFGSVADTFQQLQKQRYIVPSKVTAEDGSTQVLYELGERALSDIGEEQLKQYVESVFLEQ